MADGAAVRKKRFSILGGARSGLAVAGLLRRNGAEVFLSDRSPAEKMAQARQELERLGIPAEFGGNTRRVLEAEVLVVSPGVPSDAPLVLEAQSRGVKVVSELEVASWFCKARIVAITGTNGKTTTTTLLGRILEDARREVLVAGNIGTAFSQSVEELSATGSAVLEVSSFQLDHIETFRPAVSVLLNITPDHLDRYQHSFERYIASKSRVFENQGVGDVLIYNVDDEVTRRAVEGRGNTGVTALPFSVQAAVSPGASVRNGVLCIEWHNRTAEVIPTGSISIRGAHNLANAMAAALAARVLDVPVSSVRATLKNFKGVEHRLEFVRELNGVTFVNDSKATNVDSVWYALQSFRQPIVVMLGGRDKGNDYGRLLDLVRKHVKAIVAIGESADKVVRAFTGIVPVKEATSMEEAVRTAAAAAAKGDVVLLSPACASFDWFDNYEHRGRVFKELVMGLH